MKTTAKISQRAIALLLVVLMILSSAEFSTIFAVKSLTGFSVYQDGSVLKYWDVDKYGNGTYEPSTAAYIHVTSGDYAGTLAYCIENVLKGPKGQTYDGNNPWAIANTAGYYGPEWAEGIRAILAYGYPNVNRPFGTLSDTEAYYATTQAIRFWVAQFSSEYSYYFANLKSFSNDQLRSYARTGSIPGRVKSLNASGDRALVAAIELYIKAKNKEGPTPSYEILTPTIKTSLEDTNGNGIADAGDYYIGYLKLASKNTYRFVIDTSKLPLGTKLTDVDNGYSVTIDGGGSTAFNENKTDATIKIAIPLSYSGSRGQEEINDNMMFTVGVAWSGMGPQSQNNIIVAQPRDASVDGGYQKVAFLGNDEYRLDARTFTISTGNAIPDDGHLEITKLDAATGRAIPGVEFSLQRADKYSDPILKTTDSSGKATWSYVPVGEYTLTESTPAGYKPSEPTTVVISANTTERVTIRNVPQNSQMSSFGKIQVVKRDAATGSSAQGDASLAGGIFTIYSNGTNEWIDEKGEMHSYSNGEVVETLFSSSSEAISKELPYGNYYVRETQAPVGYNINNSTSYVELNSAQVAVVVQDTVITNTIRINKYMDSLSVPEPNVQFNIYSANLSYDDNDTVVVSKGGLVTSITTNASGTAVSKSLPYGRYYIEQTTTTPGYNYIDDFTVFISSATENYTFDRINLSYKAKLVVTKTNTDTGKPITSSSACFKIKNQLGSYISNGTGGETFCTTNGIVETDPLGPGTYNIEEVQAPEGYYKDPNGVTFKIGEENGSIDGTSVINVTFENTPIKGELTVYKVGEVLGTPHAETYQDSIYYDGSAHTVNYTAMSLVDDKPLAGASIVVKAANDIYWPDGSLAVSRDAIVANFTSTTDGYVISDLAPGRYAVTELKAPTGYIRDEETHYVDITSQGETVKIVSANASINNQMMTTKIVINKEVSRINSTTNESVPAGTYAFGIYTNQDFNVNSTNVARDTLVAVLTNGNNDSLKLPAGSYYVKELGLTSSGNQTGKYTRVNLNSNQFEFTIDYSNSLTNELTININNGQAIINSEAQIPKKDVTIYKYETVGTQSTPLNGATLQVKDASGNVVFTGKTQNGTGLTVTLDPGIYTLSEIEAPEGYFLNPTEATFTVDANGNVTGQTSITDSMTSVVLRKTNNLGTGLAGAKFDIYDSNMKFITQSDSTDSNGNVTISKLMAGEYKFKEAVAPAGYALSDEIFSFTLNGDGTVTGTTSMVDYECTITIIDLDDASSAKIPGSEFHVYKDNGTKTYPAFVTSGITNADGKIELTTLGPGDYKLTQYSVPNGYILNTTPQYVTTSGNVCVGNNVSFTNKLSGLAITKTDSVTGSPVSGAKVRIWNDINSYNETKTTDGSGMISLIGLPVGNYSYQETEAPSGYKLNSTIYNFEISQVGVVSGTITFTNDPSEAVIHKTDLTSGAPIPGAKIVIYDSKNTVYTEKITDANGNITLGSIPAGKYTFQETVAPKGYILDETLFSFEVASDGTISGTTSITNEKNRLVFNKVNEDGEPMEGVQFMLSNRTEGEIGTFTTDAQGQLVFSGLTVGVEYTLTEIETIDGYQLLETPSKFTVGSNGKIVGSIGEGITIVNAKTKVVIDKQSSTGQYLEGAVINVKGEANNYDQTFTTNAEGKIVIRGLSAGSYIIKEITAPQGYQLNENEYRFIVDKHGNIEGTTTIIDAPIPIGDVKTFSVPLTKQSTDGTYLSGAKISVTNRGTAYSQTFVTGSNGKIIVNDLLPGVYTIRELEAPDGYEINNNEYQFTLDEKGNISGTTTIIDNPIPDETNVSIYKQSSSGAFLPDATITITGKDVEYSKTAVTNASGEIALLKLVPGTYIIKETVAPSGYQLDYDEHEFTIDENGKVTGTTVIVDDPIEIPLPTTTANVTISKTNTAGEFLPGAKINVANRASGYNETFITGADGKFTIDNLPVGTYTIKEIEAPEGYKLNSTSYEFKINSSGIVTGTTMIVNEPVPAVITPEMTHDVTILKVDEEDRPLAGVSFTFYRNGNKLYTMTTDAYGQIKLTGIPNGEYTYEEVDTLKGYVKSNVIYRFVATDNGVSGDFKVINYSEQALIAFTKRDANTGNLVPGATFLIKSADGSIERQIVLDETGSMNVDGLTPGNYTLQEIAAPDRYALNPSIYNFTINEDYSVTGNTDITDELVKINILKTNESSMPLENAVFGLFAQGSESASYTVKTDKYGMATFEGVARGHYILKEIQAPDGYALTTKEVEIIVTDTWLNSDDEFVFINTKIGDVPHDTPKTSDESPVTMFSILIGISTLGAAFMIYLLKKKGKPYEVYQEYEEYEEGYDDYDDDDYEY